MSTALDLQLGDLAWCIATGLRAGYSLPQVFEAISIEAPEPAASACKLLVTELQKGADMKTALSNWKQALPSPALSRLVGVLDQPCEIDGFLADQLDPLSEEFLAQYGSDPAFYPSMRREAEQLGAEVPGRAILR